MATRNGDAPAAPLSEEVRHSGMLRVATAGSVDDGKSTLIGRLLYDSKQVFQDQYDAVERTSTERGETRADDRVTEAAMEDRKRRGYF